MLPKCAPGPKRTRLNIVGSVRSDRRELDLTDRELACIYCHYLFTFLRASRGFAASAAGSLARHKVKGWKQSFATLGRFDVVDIVEADDPKDIERAAMIIRGYGHSTTETLLATPWKDFLTTL